MHLRLPLVACVVTLAAGAALLRSHGFALSGSPKPASSSDGSSLAVASTHVRSSLGTLPTISDGRGESGDAASRRSPANPQIVRPAPIVVYVAGEVVHPGLFRLPLRSRADDAVRAAGGARDDADLVALNLAAPLADGDEVAVLAKNAEAAPRSHRRTRRAASNVSSQDAATSKPPRKKRAHRKRRLAADATLADTAPNDLIDLNHADASELETLPGIGSALAERIVTVREASGSFTSVDDLLDVGGMTQGRLDALLPFVVVR